MSPTTDSNQTNSNATLESFPIGGSPATSSEDSVAQKTISYAGVSPEATIPALPPKPKNARFDTLDSVRGIACLMLVFYHAAFYSDYSWQTTDSSTWTLGGFAISLISRLWMGVPMFFVVSGYCIAASVDSLRRRPHSLSNYFYRRFRRIYPPLWAGFGFVIAVTLLVGAASQTVLDNCLQLPRLDTFSVSDWIGNFAAATSWLPKLAGGDSQYLLRNTWTLCYEEQFYVITGLILLCSARRFFLIAYIVAAATIVARHVCRATGIPTDGFFFNGHWLLFAAGILLYQHVNYLKGRAALTAILAFGVAASYGLGERLFAASPLDQHMGEYIFVSATFAVFLSAIKRWDQEISSHWILAPFRWCGKISYSIYLTHFPITVLLACLLKMAGIHEDGQVFLITIPLCLVVSIPVSWLFYQHVERHFVNSPAKSTSSPT